MLEKITSVAIAITALIGALASVCGVLANVLPDGKWKTAMSYAGLRLGKAHDAAKGVLPKGGAK